MDKTYTVAICGTRGVPANYGGFETFAEELGTSLVSRGVNIIVYSRSYEKVREDESISYYKGMKVVKIKAPKHKYFETPIHSLKSFFHPSLRDADIILLCNAANSPFAFIPRLFSKPLIINVDGIEKERRKWNFIGKAWYRLGELTSVLFGSELITDADYIQDYYQNKYNCSSTVIRYGARCLDEDLAESKSKGDFSHIEKKYGEILKDLGLSVGNYFLYVSRLEPENNADKVISAYGKLDIDIRNKFPLVIVGDAPYAEEFKQSLRQSACSNVVFLGYQFGEQYLALQAGAFSYIQATEVGGTHPALVEAMGFSNCILANDVREHREVTENTALYYLYNDINDLATLMDGLARNENQVFSLRKSTYLRARKVFTWEAICDSYQEVFRRFLSLPDAK